MAVIIMGVSGSGKSTLGRTLAQTLGCPFLEGDDFHDAAAIAKMSHGDPLTDDDRWPWLDRLGAAIAGAVADGGLAVAACSALRRSYRDRLITAIPAPTRFVLLDNDRDELRRRIANRPLHYMPPSLLDSQLQTLERPAAGERAMAFDAGAAPAVLCGRVLAWLQQSGADR
ncbi:MULTISPECIES: gluconokinase [unclassified Sphingomonas]|uniref:gluconokinase n=1 Tax=unclassified Sphingomonas TaxID=196159 RepID=UPI00226AC133|nr:MULTISPECIES: gluconokinase [unclassified Sphingomonas]